nr:PREDICTED: uncharacterized protein LOC104152081 [Struthio camelus australis]
MRKGMLIVSKAFPPTTTKTKLWEDGSGSFRIPKRTVAAPRSSHARRKKSAKQSLRSLACLHRQQAGSDHESREKAIGDCRETHSTGSPNEKGTTKLCGPAEQRNHCNTGKGTRRSHRHGQQRGQSTGAGRQRLAQGDRDTGTETWADWGRESKGQTELAPRHGHSTRRPDAAGRRDECGPCSCRLLGRGGKEEQGWERQDNMAPALGQAASETEETSTKRSVKPAEMQGGREAGTVVVRRRFCEDPAQQGQLRPVRAPEAGRGRSAYHGFTPHFSRLGEIRRREQGLHCLRAPKQDSPVLPAQASICTSTKRLCAPWKTC